LGEGTEKEENSKGTEEYGGPEGIAKRNGVRVDPRMNIEEGEKRTGKIPIEKRQSMGFGKEIASTGRK